MIKLTMEHYINILQRNTDTPDIHVDMLEYALRSVANQKNLEDIDILQFIKEVIEQKQLVDRENILTEMQVFEKEYAGEALEYFREVCKQRLLEYDNDCHEFRESVAVQAVKTLLLSERYLQHCGSIKSIIKAEISEMYVKLSRYFNIDDKEITLNIADKYIISISKESLQVKLN